MTILLLALSITLDSLWIGVSYGLKRIKLSTLAVFIIIFISLGVLVATWAGGQVILTFISLSAAKKISSLLLIFVGIIFIVQAILDKGDEKISLDKPEIDKRGIIKGIFEAFRHPLSGDIDHSGIIDAKEAIYLGGALSADALAVGFTLAVYKINLPIFLFSTSLANILMLKGGELLGQRISRFLPDKISKLVSGFSILFMGILRLF